MEAIKGVLSKSAIWCGILNVENRPVPAGGEVRTVRGPYTALCDRDSGRSRNNRLLSRPPGLRK